MNEMWHARNGIVALCCARGRIWSRRREPGPGACQRLKRCPAPAHRKGGSTHRPALIAIAVCTFTAAGNDRSPGRAVDQADWPGRPGPDASPWDPIGARHRMSKRSRWSWTAGTRRP
jgi:hypothetical protein